jgi:hydrogenase-4 component E
MFVAFCTLVIKAIAAPIFFSKLINKHEAIYSVSTYLNAPLSLIVIAALAAVAFSDKFAPLTTIVPANQMLLQLALSSIFMSLFLVVNRRGAISQIIGVLSLENSIVCFAVLASLEQSAMLQIGILFDIAIWIVIAIVFISMIYAHFGSLDITNIKHLKD